MDYLIAKEPEKSDYLIEPEPETPAQPQGLVSKAKDTAVSFGIGANSLLQMAGDFYGLATGDMGNVVSQQAKENIQYLQQRKSPELRQAEEARRKAIEADEDELGKALTYVRQTVTNPSLLSNALAEQVPNLVGTGGAGALAKAGAEKVLLKTAADQAAKRLAAKKAAQIGTGAAVGAGAAMQGTDVGADLYDEAVSALDKITDEQAMSIPEIASLMEEKEATLDEAKTAFALALGREAFALGATVSAGAQMLPGGRTIERAFVGKQAGRRLAGAITGGLGEAASEAVEEGGSRVAANLLARQFEPDRPLAKGVGEAVGQAAVVGGIPGAAFGAASSRPTTQPAPEGQTTAGKTGEAPASAATKSALAGAPEVALESSEGLTPEQFYAAVNIRQARLMGGKPDPEDIRIAGEVPLPKVQIDPEKANRAIEEARSALQEWVSSTPNAPQTVEVIFDPELLHNGYGVQGYYKDDGTIAINAAFVSPDRVASIANHEWAHVTLATEAGQKAFADFVQREIPQAELDALAARYNTQDRRVLLEEWIAQNQEKAPGVIERIVARIREWLAGLGVINLSDAEVADIMLRTLRQQVENRIQPDTYESMQPAQGERFSLTEQPKRISGVIGSPSVTDINYDRAKRNLTSANQARFKSQISEYAPEAEIFDAVGDWVDGSENSVAAIFQDRKSGDELQRLAAQVGLAGDQKAVLWWRTEPEGPDAIHEMIWPKGVSMDEARQAMIDVGLENRTLIQTPEGVRGFVFDQGRKNLNKIEALNEHETQPSLESSPASGDFLGSWTSRAEGRRAYRRVLGSAPQAQARAGELRSGEVGGVGDGGQPETRFSLTETRPDEMGFFSPLQRAIDTMPPGGFSDYVATPAVAGRSFPARTIRDKEGNVIKEIPARTEPDKPARIVTAEEQLRSHLEKSNIKKEEMDDIRDLSGQSFSDWIKDNSKATKDQIAQFVAENQVSVTPVLLEGEKQYEITQDGERTELIFDSPEAAREYIESQVQYYQSEFRIRNNSLYDPSGEEILRIEPSSQQGARTYKIIDPNNPDSVISTSQFTLGEARDFLKYQISLLGDREYERYNVVGKPSATFEQYTLPGGENYQEDVLTLPKGARGAGYRSNHYPDIPDYLAHVRTKDRVTTDGQSVLFVEEIQSDLHQQARKRGYKGTESPEAKTERFRQVAEIRAKMEENAVEQDRVYTKRRELESDLDDAFEKQDVVEHNRLTAQIEVLRQTAVNLERIYAGLQGEAEALSQVPDEKGLPSAPFKKTWHEMAFKYLLHEAVRNGVDYLAWTTGEQQNNRYPGLATRVRGIEWNTPAAAWLLPISSSAEKAQKTHRVVSLLQVGSEYPIDLKVEADGTVHPLGRGNEAAMRFEGSNLSELIGAGVASRILNEPSGRVNTQDLVIDSEGMSGFYDQILPQFAAKYLKKFGIKPQNINVVLKKQAEEASPLNVPGEEGTTVTMPQTSAVVNAVRITPEMKQEFRTRGQPRYSLTSAKTSEFKRWFGNSELVDEQGKPLQLYHGTNQDITEFKPGSYVTDDPEYASEFGDRVMPVYVAAKKIKRLMDEDFRLLAGRRTELQKYIDQGYDALTTDDGGAWIVLDPTKIKSATGNTGAFDPENPDIRYSLTSAKPRSVSTVGVTRETLNLPLEGAVPKSAVAKALNDMSRGLLGGEEFDDDQLAIAHGVMNAVAEGRHQLLLGDKSGADWYDTDIDTAKKYLRRALPGLKTDTDMVLFTAVMAPTSFGQNPLTNVATAVRIYEAAGEKPWGNLPPRQESGKGWTTRGKAVELGLSRLNQLVEERGERGTVAWLLKKHPISELRKYNKNVSGRAGDLKYGAYIFGPKGGPFFLNMNGIREEMTKDLWWSRTFNRWFGTMEETVRAAPDEEGEGQTEQQEEAEEFRIQETPRNDAERRRMDAIANQAAQRLGLTIEELQATLWYYEQQLWKRLGAKVESYSFKDGALRILEKRGIERPRIRRSDSPNEQRRQAAYLLAASESRPQPVETQPVETRETR